MTARVACSIVALAALVASGRARADEPPAGSSDDAAFEAAVAEGAGEATPRETVLLLLTTRDTPAPLRDDVAAMLREVGTLVDPDDYERESRAVGLPPESAEAMAAILPRMLPDLNLVVVVGVNSPRRPTAASFAYHDAYGLRILEEEHALAGSALTISARVRALAETRLALTVITRPREGLAAVGGGVEPGAREAGLAVHVGVSAGAGVGTREFSVPTENGVLGLDTAVFPAAALALAVDVEPTARGRLSLGADVEYQTSVGLVTTDMRIDGSVRETGSRSQRLVAGLHLAYRVDDPSSAPSFTASLGWASLSFSSVAPITLPDYGLGGPVLALGVEVPFGDGAASLSITPEAQWIAVVGDALRALGVAGDAVCIGGSARLRVRLVDALAAELAYREAHALLGGTFGGGADVERFATLRLVYRP